jgi:ABC-2 type transport system ATP-binding protein
VGKYVAMTAAAPRIQVDGLRKSFGKTRALHDVALDVGHGEVVGFIGPNGAGKSTTIRVLLDLIRADAGTVRVLGGDPARAGAKLRADIGFVPGDLALWPRMRVRDTFELFARLRGMAGAAQAFELAERFDLDLDRAVGDLSSGNRRKVGLVQAFMHAPQLYILDEPTSGLDPLMQRRFADLLRERVSGGASALVSSHALDEVEHVADRLAVVREGTVVEHTSVHELVSRMPLHVVARRARPIDVAALVRGLDGTRGEQRDECTVFIEVTGELAPLLARLANEPLVDLDAGRPDLADAFVALYEEAPGR